MRRLKGFTLIEALLVIAVIAIIAALAIPRITNGIANAQRDACLANIAMINSQLELYRLNTGAYPADAAAFNNLLNNTNYFTEAPVCPVDSGNLYNYDATNHRVNRTGHEH